MPRAGTGPWRMRSQRPRVARPVAFRVSAAGFRKRRCRCRPSGLPAGEGDPRTRRRMRQGAAVETSSRIIDTGARYPLTSQDFFGHRGRRTAPMTKYVYFFGGGRAEGSSVMRNLLGGKGCELAEMTNLGIPVPPGFTVTTQAWAHYNRSGHEWPEELWDQTLENLQRLESAADAGFGDPKRPLLVSVRSGARVSMPGMMETILNLGLNDATVEGLAARPRNERFAWDCYRRFGMMFGDVVPEEWGTAVTVMSMVFGNLGETSGTGVGFTRDPRTGEPRFYAEFLPNAQGEDVVAGIRTPLPIEALHQRMPEIYDEVLEIAG